MNPCQAHGEPGYRQEYGSSRLYWIQTDPGTTPACERMGARALAVEATPCPSSFGASARARANASVTATRESAAMTAI